MTIEFADDERNKRAELDINYRGISIDQKDKIYTKTLNDDDDPDFVEEGNNFIKIEPRTELDIIEIRVDIVEI